MNFKRSILAPLLVVLAASLSGGWLLQQHPGEEENPARRARLLDEVIEHLADRYVDERSESELYRMAVEGLLRELGDPHTSFLTAEDYEDLAVQTTGEYGGLGIEISVRDGWITIISALPDTPAERAGLIAGDRIVEVEGESTEGWSDQDAVNALRGPKGAPVNISIARPGVNEPIPYRVVRDEIHIHAVPFAYRLSERVGYLKLTLFSETATEEIEDAIQKLRDEGADGLILDLRQNPGGLLEQGVAVSDLFLERGETILEIRSRDPRQNQSFRASTPESHRGLRVVVLVDSYSASAAEIVAGALQDHDRALVVGEGGTFGKGSVQTLYPLSGGNFLKLTTGRWYTPAGRSIQRDHDSDDPALLTAADAHPDGDLSAREPVDTAGRETYQTDSGRVVYGGGGIIPDLLVQSEPDEEEEEFLAWAYRYLTEMEDAAFQQAVELGRAQPRLSADFRVTDAMLDDFLRRLAATGAEPDPEEFAAARDWVERFLSYRIARHRFGAAVASRRGAEFDQTIQTALNLLENAPDQEALFAMAKRRGALDEPSAVPDSPRE
ncbi:MAG: S41 family peptidase [Longimicrobiaceae bacterium]